VRTMARIIVEIEKARTTARTSRSGSARQLDERDRPRRGHGGALDEAAHDRLGLRPGARGSSASTARRRTSSA
jgi:hypothetical protein